MRPSRKTRRYLNLAERFKSPPRFSWRSHLFQIYAACNKKRKRKRKHDRSRNDLWVISPGSLPAGQQDVAVAMPGAGQTQVYGVHIPQETTSTWPGSSVRQLPPSTRIYTLDGQKSLKKTYKRPFPLNSPQLLLDSSWGQQHPPLVIFSLLSTPSFLFLCIPSWTQH